MINILSCVGMNMQSEVCLWTLLGLVRTIFDATLFRVNANLKQVWQMTMPEELSMPVQRVLRTMISGVMLVQCFTVYVYLASYIVLLYPVFLEERPTLVLPWLLLAAVRKLLCELTCLALGLGTCVLLGAARPPCIKFVIVKFASIMPAFYMWMLVFSYYHSLKVASAFKTFPAVLPANEHDYGLELAVRRRRTKSLLGEDQLRKKLVANFYGDTSSINNQRFLRPMLEISSRMVHSTDTSLEEVVPEIDTVKPLTMSTTGWSDIGAYEDWFGSEVMIPRDTDRILEQIVLMLLRIGAYLKKEGIESIIDSQILNSAVPESWHHRDNIECAAMNADDTETPPLVGSSKGNMASYLREYPQIFMKRQGTEISPTERTIVSLKTVHSHVGTEDVNTTKSRKNVTPNTSDEIISVEVENVASKRKITITDNLNTQEDTNNKLILPRKLNTKQSTKTNEEKTQKQKKIGHEQQVKDDLSNIPSKVTAVNQDSSLNISETYTEVEYIEELKSSYNVSLDTIENRPNLPESKISRNKNRSKETMKAENDEMKQSLNNASLNDTRNGLQEVITYDKECVDNTEPSCNTENTEKYQPTTLSDNDLLSIIKNDLQLSETLGRNDSQAIESMNNSSNVLIQRNSGQLRKELKDNETKSLSDRIESKILNNDQQELKIFQNEERSIEKSLVLSQHVLETHSKEAKNDEMKLSLNNASFNEELKSSYNVSLDTIENRSNLPESEISRNKNKSKETIKAENDEMKQSLNNASLNDRRNGLQEVITYDKECVDNTEPSSNNEKTEKYETATLSGNGLSSLIKNDDLQQSKTFSRNDSQVIEPMNNSSNVLKQRTLEQLRNELEDYETNKLSDNVSEIVNNGRQELKIFQEDERNIETIQAVPVLDQVTVDTASDEINKASMSKENKRGADSKISLKGGKGKESERTISSQESNQHNSEQNNKKIEHKETP